MGQMLCKLSQKFQINILQILIVLHNKVLRSVAEAESDTVQ